jgi:nitrogen fixation/metabolism regulation signal transduction histidine kinase
MTPATERTARVQTSVERFVLLLVLLGGLPGAGLVYLLWAADYRFEVRWTLSLLVVIVIVTCAALARQAVVRILHVSANLLGALREGDYSIRGYGAEPGSATHLLMSEINALSDTLQRQRGEAVESIALLTNVMQAIDVVVLAFDPASHLVLVNPAGERLFGSPSAQLLGRDAASLGVEGYLAGPTPRLVDPAFGPHGRRFELRRSGFRREGVPHQLLVLADVSRALREQEQLAWQRIVRVLSHEINNSLTPIKSIAHSLRRIVSRVADLPRRDEVLDSLSLIETRSGALGRFLRAYAQLAKLPRPDPRPFDLLPLVHRVVGLESRRQVEVRPAGGLHLAADADQLEQLLINLVRNAVDAALETGGRAWVDWSRDDTSVRIVVEDEGKGLPDTANLFVPFFTTKPAGSGIGLVLCRQIAEAHGGSLTLEGRLPEPGTRAVLRLPAPRIEDPHP